MLAHTALQWGKVLTPSLCLLCLAVHVPDDQHRHDDRSRQAGDQPGVGGGAQALHRNDVTDLRRKGPGHRKGPHAAAHNTRQQVGGQVRLLKELERDGIDGEDDDKAVDAAVAQQRRRNQARHHAVFGAEPPHHRFADLRRRPADLVQAAQDVPQQEDHKVGNKEGADALYIGAGHRIQHRQPAHHCYQQRRQRPHYNGRDPPEDEYGHAAQCQQDAQSA